MEMNGVEKIFCAHGGWVTIAHVAHLTGDPSILTQNVPQVLQYLLKRHPRMRSRIRVDGQLISRPYGLLYPVISFIGKHHLKQSLRNSRQPRIPVKSIPLTDCEQTTFHVQRHKIRFLFSSSSSNLYLNLHKQCRLHEVTLQGPLLSCLLLAIHNYFPLDDKDQLDPFEIEMDFDMRSRLPQSSLTPMSVG
ncbi:unnamed protein product, partial [Rotaria sp. Silwood1]